jgi:phosphatidylglycerol---prolipoprotein diacylglyceryl transferase
MDIFVHNLSPFAIRFTETLGIRWYGLAYLSGLVFGWISIRLVAKKGITPLTAEDATDFTTYCALGVLGGGRLGYCLFYAPDLLVHFDSIFPFWGVLKVNEGGMASHGGILGVMLVCYYFGKKHKVSILHLMDLVVLGGSLGFFFGRIANFINGELFGRAAPATLSWAVKFPQEMYLWMQREVGRLIDVAPAAEALGSFRTPDGQVVPLTKATYVGWVQNISADNGSRNAVQQTIEQIIAAIQAGNVKVTEALAPFLTARYPSQLIQALLEGLFVFIILCIIWIKPRKPGVLGASFGVLYGVARIVGEQFRMPDPQIGFQLWGLTRGQWLSVALLLGGILFLVIVSRRNVAPMGGFSRPEDPAPPEKKRRK